MTAALDRRRRGTLCAIAALALSLPAAPVAAQDPRGGEAQNAARAWLALSDNQNAAESWEATDSKFKNAMSVERWTTSLQQVRGPLGAVVQRTVLSTRFTKSLPGLPPGDYAVVVFRSSFEHKTSIQETVTLDHGSDGIWRVAGYALA